MITFNRHYASLILVFLGIVFTILWVGNQWVLQEQIRSKAIEAAIFISGLFAVLGVIFVFSHYLLVRRLFVRPISVLSNGENLAMSSSNNCFEIQQLSDRFISLHNQISEMEEKLKHQSLHDRVTGLPNKMFFFDRLDQFLKDAQRNCVVTAVIVMNLERFKAINITLGNHLGDELLRIVGARLVNVLRDLDTVSHLHGNEFAILLHKVDIGGATTVANKISNTMELPFQIEAHQLLMSCTQGIAFYPEHGKTSEELVKHAHIALDIATRGHLKNSFYDVSLDNNNLSNISLSADLRQAINNNELQLYYQPKVNSNDGIVIETEALLRWIHPKNGFISPEEIVKSAEQSGFINPLTEWVIDTAISQTDLWQKQGMPIGVSVNLSAYNLQNPHLVPIVQYFLSNSTLEPSQLILEITESAMMANPKLAATVLTSFSEMGLKISIDDFGTGYSSLVYLKNLPVHELKIDRSFVMNIVTDTSDYSIVKSTIDLAHNLGLSVVAEGVEDQASWDVLDSLGCDTIQGYFVSKPLPPQEFETWYWKYSQEHGKLDKSA